MEMKWELIKARNGRETLLLNGIYLYSKYDPEKEVSVFISHELKSNYNKFIVFGLGLGYHIEKILDEVPTALIKYILIDKKELEFCSKKVLQNSHVQPFTADENFNGEAQIIIPQSFLSALDDRHPLFSFIEDIKIRQTSYEKFKNQMLENFERNITYFTPIEKPTLLKNKAALVSAGPSLNDTIHWLKEHVKEVDIYCVGSALKTLLRNEIFPNKVFITDAQDNILKQIPENYKGDLIFLSTANYKAVQKHKGNKQIIFQEGYNLAEITAKENNQPLFETGGSVATTIFSYLEWLEYKNVYLFGQDFGFVGLYTHAEGSTSSKIIKSKDNLKELEANDGGVIYTTRNLITYKRWMERAIKKTKMTVWNTGLKSAKLNGAIFLNVL